MVSTEGYRRENVITKQIGVKGCRDLHQIYICFYKYSLQMESLPMMMK